MEYNPYSGVIQTDPYPTYRWMRDEAPCLYNEQRDFYALSRFADVWDATLDWRTFSSRLGPILENRGEIPGEVMSIIGMDPPRHTRLRNIASRGFTPNRIAALEAEVREIAASYLDPLVGAGGFDIQTEFAVRFPMDVISVLLGIPEADREQIRRWTDLGLERDADGIPPPEGLEGMARSGEYMLELLRERRREPREDLISVMAVAEVDDGEGLRRLRDEEVRAFCGLLAAAGAETTAKLIGNSLVHLFHRPDQRKLLWDDPARIPLAIEELLRFDAPSQFQGRVAERDVELHGVTIPKDARVALVTGAACRDEREFQAPDQLDLSRRPEREIYFGYGQHFCVGKSLARLETRVALEEVANRFPDYQVVESGLTRTYQAHVRGFASVPIEIGR
jgi:cytochrome P450